MNIDKLDVTADQLRAKRPQPDVVMIRYNELKVEINARLKSFLEKDKLDFRSTEFTIGVNDRWSTKYLGNLLLDSPLFEGFVKSTYELDGMLYFKLGW